jgi:betaine-aldehyde dehydrogenase
MQADLYIDGGWRKGNSARAIEVVDPSTEIRYRTLQAASAADIAAAVGAASRAFNGEWRETTGPERGSILRSIAAGIRSRRVELAEEEVRNNGKPLPEALWDVDDSAGCFDYYALLAEGIETRQEELIRLPTADFESNVRNEPIGPVGQIIPWNYPLLMAAWKVAPALAAGCTTVLKPSEITPITALMLAEIADETELPPGVLNIVPGYGAEAGAELVKSRALRKIAFTGSLASGRLIMAEAARGPIPVTLELGGKSPIVVFEDVDLEAAVEWIMFGVLWNKGEVCSATSRLLVDERIAGPLLERLVEECRRVRIGPGMEPGVKLGPVVSKAQCERIFSYIETGRTEGARLITGGGRPPGLKRGYFVEPTIFDRCNAHMRIWREEIFGPVLCAMAFRDEDEALRLANDTEYGLGGAVLSRDIERAGRVARALEAGVVWINCSQPTFTEAPWGGYKASGIGRELGPWGLASYQQVKQITTYCSSTDWGWFLPRRPEIPPRG